MFSCIWKKVHLLSVGLVFAWAKTPSCCVDWSSWINYSLHCCWFCWLTWVDVKSHTLCLTLIFATLACFTFLNVALVVGKWAVRGCSLLTQVSVALKWENVLQGCWFRKWWLNPVCWHFFTSVVWQEMQRVKGWETLEMMRILGKSEGGESVMSCTPKPSFLSRWEAFKI